MTWNKEVRGEETEVQRWTKEVKEEVRGDREERSGRVASDTEGDKWQGKRDAQRSRKGEYNMERGKGTRGIGVNNNKLGK